jgi:hypothetical protein
MIARTIIVATVCAYPSALALQFPECSTNALVCFREIVFREHGPFDYIAALQAGLDRNAPQGEQE